MLGENGGALETCVAKQLGNLPGEAFCLKSLGQNGEEWCQAWGRQVRCPFKAGSCNRTVAMHGSHAMRGERGREVSAWEKESVFGKEAHETGEVNIIKCVSCQCVSLKNEVSQRSINCSAVGEWGECSGVLGTGHERSGASRARASKAAKVGASSGEGRGGRGCSQPGWLDGVGATKRH